MRIPSILTVLLCSAAIASAQKADPVAPDPASEPATSKPLHVLLVTHNPTAPKIPFARDAEPRTRRLFRERAAAWEALLRYHFEHVRVVYGDDYDVSMSDAAHVTIFDARPKALTEAKRGKDPVTGEATYAAATFLPESFDRPAILISDNSPRIGEPLGLKLDWL